MAFSTLEEAGAFMAHFTRAQSMMMAAILRPLLNSGALKEADLRASLEATERAALERRTPETPALLGLVQVLRVDLGLSEASGHGGAKPRPS